jgi:hypothetical protein
MSGQIMFEEKAREGVENCKHKSPSEQEAAKMMLQKARRVDTSTLSLIVLYLTHNHA